jgi:hypothetical protein
MAMKKYFKFVFMALLIALCVGFTSCSKDDEGDIVGLWHFVSMTADIQNPSNPELEENEKNMFALSAVFVTGSTIEFKSDGTFVMTVWSQSITGTYTNEGDYFSMTANGETIDDTTAVSVTVRDGVLTMVEDLLDAERRSQGFTKYEQTTKFKK